MEDVLFKYVGSHVKSQIWYTISTHKIAYLLRLHVVSIVVLVVYYTTYLDVPQITLRRT